MKVIADLQIHSRFSRAVSPQMNVPTVAEWAAKKGIGLVATGDWTHPIWLRELKANLEEVGEGIYKPKITNYQFPITNEPLFLLSTEVSSIYTQGGKGRRIHTLIFVPNFDVVDRINKELSLRGANLLSDGRPIVGLSARTVAEIALGVDERCLVIPAHAWTPHFSLYGSLSGFDSIEECFGDLAPQVFAIETGLSSDPAMNWRIAELSGRRIVSFSDAHSPQKLGREATVFEINSQRLEVSYELIRQAITGLTSNSQPPMAEIAYTIEFYPEEGKYHYTGHRNCKIVYSPNETRKMGTTCPVCGRSLTVGVMSRVEHLASLDVETKSEVDKYGVRWIRDKEGKRNSYVMLVPLMEILAEALSSSAGSQKVLGVYDQLTASFGGEFNVLLETPVEEIKKVGGEKVAEGISKVRSGDIVIEPGYDGVFGTVKIWKEDGEVEESINQGVLF